MDAIDIELNFADRELNTGQKEALKALRQKAQEFASKIGCDCCLPPSRESALALTKLEEALLWAEAAVKRPRTIADAFAAAPTHTDDIGAH